jgi:hypothetical protein
MLHGLVLIALLCGGQEGLDEELRALADRLAPGETEAKLAALVRTERGAALVSAEIDRIVEAIAGRIEEAWIETFQAEVFETKEGGRLTVKADSVALFQRIAASLPSRLQLLEHVEASLTELASKMSDEHEIDREIRDRLGDRDARLVIFHSLISEARDSDPMEVLRDIITESVTRGQDGRLHVRPEAEERLNEIMQEALELSSDLRSVGRELARIIDLIKDEEAKALLSRSTGKMVVLEAIQGIEESGEEEAEPYEVFLEKFLAGSAEDGYVPSERWASLVEWEKRLADAAAWVKTQFDLAAKQLGDTGFDGKLKRFILSERARLEAGRQIIEIQSEAKTRLEWRFAQIGTLFTRDRDGRLTYRFKELGEPEEEEEEEDGRDLRRLFVSLPDRVETMHHDRALLLLIADRVDSEPIARLLASKVMLQDINVEIQALIERKTEAVRADPIAIFVRAFFEEDRRGRLRVRPHRVQCVQDLLDKAEQEEQD